MRHIRFSIIGENASADAELLSEQAPQTADAVWNILPVAGRAHHAVYSGSEGVLILPETLRIPPEAATADVEAGDVGFTWFDAGSSHGVTEAFAEVCWFYDDDARPSMHEGPAPVSIFARFVGETRDFYAACRRMRREGTKAMVVEQVTGDGPNMEHRVVYRDDFGNVAFPRLSIAKNGTLTAQFTRHTYRPTDEEDPVLSAADLTLELQSRDGGATWSEPVIIEPFYTVEGGRPVPLALTDGRTLTANWADMGRSCVAIQATLTGGGGSSKTFPIRYLPQSNMPWAGLPKLAEIAPGRVLCLYVVDEGAPDGRPPGGVCALHATMFSL